uniref:nucleolar protein 58-like n=1 Tax=Styela clava TaxID=7725 RepID=UPI001939BC0B|nr:nucleolar protein 58-like [Styela clava]
MLVLFESPAGYAVFKVLDESKVREAGDLQSLFSTAESASKMVKLKHFKKFEDMTEALSATTAAVEGKLCKPLKKLLKKIVANEAHEKLAVADAKLGNAIQDKMDLMCLYSPAIHELMRGIRAHMTSLITGLPESDVTAMALGLAHSLSRYKLKFSPDKVDTMIVQAISLLDDLDKELNNYIMRCREWYGWHFPELGKVVTDNLAFAKTVKKMGIRTEAINCDLSDILPEEIEEQVKELAEVSMGTEISEEDISRITYLCEQIIEITDYRAQLYDYLKNRMTAIAPNVTILVGELVGARLIAHAGSLLNLAKHPASTVQILGAEKALFRALKTRKETPKYGLIYHASLVGQSNPKHKGKISRMLAAKTALAIRYDALGEESSTQLGVENRALLEMRLKALEEGTSFKISGTGKAKAQADKWTNKSEVKMYDDARDSTLPGPKKRKHEEALIVSDGKLTAPCTPTAEPVKKKTKKEKKIKLETQESDDDLNTSNGTEVVKKKSKKDKKVKTEVQESSPKKIKTEVQSPQVEGKPKKKKKKSKKESE